MKRYLILSLALLAALSLSCRRSGPAPRPTIPLVLSIAADTTGPGHVAAQAGQSGPQGHIALFGEKADVIPLATLLLESDRVDNIDGRQHRDSLPDFAGECIDVFMDDIHEPYSRFFREGSSPDSLREAAVQGAIFAWDSLSRAKILILASSYQAAYGMFDVDTLQQLTGGRCHVLSPVKTALEAAMEGGARHIAVMAPDSVRLARVYESVFADMHSQATLTVITPHPQEDSCTVLRSLLRQYRAIAYPLDALVVDGFSTDMSQLQEEFNGIRKAETVEDEDLSALLSRRFRLVDSGESLVNACSSLLRQENLYSHRIHKPLVHYFISKQAPDGSIQMSPLSALYVQITYVPHLH
ncbi:MAG: hypothetical protein J5669_07940 [Bacteroidales bacterium]|nr:hypothetical protein [Bacteroidales bacterium]